MKSRRNPIDIDLDGLYPIPRPALSEGDYSRYLHLDIASLDLPHLEAEKARAAIRLYQETDPSNRNWLSERIDRILTEHAKRPHQRNDDGVDVMSWGNHGQHSEDIGEDSVGSLDQDRKRISRFVPKNSENSG